MLALLLTFPVLQAASAVVHHAVSAGGLSWSSDAGLATVFPLDIPPVRDVSSVKCAGTNPENRTCRMYNVCFDSTGPVETQDGTFALYSGTDAASVLIDIAGAGVAVPFSGGHVANKGSIYTGAPVRLLVRVRPGRIPADKVVQWIDTPLAMLGRHWPSNWAHAVCDDYFALWWILTRWMGWRPPLAGEPATSANVGALFVDDRYFHPDATPAAYRTFTEWFKGLPLVYKDANGYVLRVNHTPAGIITEETATGGRPLVCFRSVTLGVAGWTMMRGAAYAFHPARTFSEELLSPWYAEYVAAHSEFVDFLLTTYGLPRKETVQAAFDSATGKGALGKVVVVNRRDGKRELRNIDALLEGLNQSSGGREVVEVRLDALSLKDQAATMQGADLVLGIHSAGSINLMFMRPGTAFVDLLPPRGTNYQPTMLALAQRFDVRFFTMPLIEDDW